MILTVSGRLANHNGHGEMRYDRALLESLGMKTLKTHTFYSSSSSEWRGVWVRDLLKHVGAKGDKIEVIALDDYRTVIPREDFEKFNVMLAFERDGKKLSIRTRGPTRIIYPHDHHVELHDEKYAPRYVWQLKKLIVK